MGKIKIEYLGHSCFRVSSESGAAVFDPYEKGYVPGVDVPDGIKADAVYCSHEHGDHNAAHLIDISERGGVGEEAGVFPVEFVNVPHDDANGTKRGMSNVTFLEMDGVKITHLGDIGFMPEGELLKKISDSDVIMTPCAGFYTIDSKTASSIIDNMKSPSLKILMHYRTDRSGFDVQEHLKDVKENIAGVNEIGKSMIEFDPDNIPNEIIAMEPMK